MDARMRHSLDMRYTGQDFSLTVSVDPTSFGEEYRAAIRDAFHALHETRFGYYNADGALEIVNARLAAIACSRVPALPAPWQSNQPALLGIRTVIFDANAVDCPVYRREPLTPGERIDGPAVIQEYASTTVLFPEDRAEVTPTRELLIHVGRSGDCW
jgi:N-methylhydantoinase A